MVDVIIIGGSYAGLSAAMQLGRARRRVLIIDAGAPRNRFAAHSHGFFGQDGWQPAAMIAAARAQVLAYPSVAFVAGTAAHAARQEAGFVVTLADGQQHTAARLILATGVTDVLPDLPGARERWGVTLLHCPYCHGYEVAGGPLGVLDLSNRVMPGSDGTALMSIHHATLIADWGPVTLFTNSFAMDDAAVGTLRARSITVETTPVAALVGETPAQVAVALADGRTVPVRAVFGGFPTVMTSPLAEQLGCIFEAGMVGPVIQTNDWKETSVPGVFAAGDAATPMHNATLASADGVKAGASAHRSLVFTH